MTKEERKQYRKLMAYWNSDEQIILRNLKLIKDISRRSKIPFSEFMSLFKRYHKEYLLEPITKRKRYEKKKKYVCISTIIS